MYAIAKRPKSTPGINSVSFWWPVVTFPVRGHAQGSVLRNSQEFRRPIIQAELLRVQLPTKKTWFCTSLNCKKSLVTLSELDIWHESHRKKSAGWRDMLANRPIELLSRSPSGRECEYWAVSLNRTLWVLQISAVFESCRWTFPLGSGGSLPLFR